jgi:hypothetical protein
MSLSDACGHYSPGIVVGVVAKHRKSPGTLRKSILQDGYSGFHSLVIKRKLHASSSPVVEMKVATQIFKDSQDRNFSLFDKILPLGLTLGIFL